MHITCVICSDLFVPVSDVYATDCGHLFHYACLMQWLERSKSCPQCRHKTTEKSVRRIYFSVATNEPEEDASLLRNKIDNLKFQIHLKEKDIKSSSEENSKLNNQNKGLRDTIKGLEEKTKSLESTNAAFKDHIRYLKAQNESSEAAVEETKQLRKHLETLRSVQAIIQGSMEETEEILDRHGDSYEARKSLATYISVLKRELQTGADKKRELKNRLQVLEKDLSACNARLIEEKRSKSRLNKQFKDMQHTEQNSKSLKKKLQDLETASSLAEGKIPNDAYLRRLISSNPLLEGAKRPRLSDPSQDSSGSDLGGPLSSPGFPHPSLKLDSFPITPLKISQSSNTVRFSKFHMIKQQMEQYSLAVPDCEQAYDGLGGHTKLDIFPVPKPNLPASRKQKRVLKKHAAVGTSKLDTFFNLT